MDAPVRVLLADDHPLFRTELRQLLAEAPRIEVVGEAADGDEALAAVQTLRPDVAILDLEMPRKDGLEVARAVRNLGLSTKVVLLTVHKSQALVTKAVECGVTGYVLKDDAFSELLECVRAVHAGRPYFSAQLSPFLLS